tara:strand:+ start:56 stop:589 length:534 start_codon:yes stop_codon:yes gene_type:complete
MHRTNFDQNLAKDGEKKTMQVVNNKEIKTLDGKHPEFVRYKINGQRKKECCNGRVFKDKDGKRVFASDEWIRQQFESYFDADGMPRNIKKPYPPKSAVLKKAKFFEVEKLKPVMELRVRQQETNQQKLDIEYDKFQKKIVDELPLFAAVHTDNLMTTAPHTWNLITKDYPQKVFSSK